MRLLVELIVTIGLVVVAEPLAAQDAPGGDNRQSTLVPETRTIAVLPLEISTDHAGAAELAESAFEKTLRTLASIDGVRVLGPEVTLPYANSELSRDDIGVILEELGAVAVLKALIRGQWPSVAFQLSLRRPDGMSGYLALLTLDPQITLNASDSMLETELSRLVSDVQALFLSESVESPQ